MTLQDWGAIGEVVGALAVVVTLIYLAKQIGQNTRAIDAPPSPPPPPHTPSSSHNHH